MAYHSETLEPPSGTDAAEMGSVRALVVVGCVQEPERLGEVALLTDGGEPAILGREGSLVWIRQRPDGEWPRKMLQDRHLSRKQIHFQVVGSQLHARNVGRLPLRHNGLPVTACMPRPGDLLQVGSRLLLLVTERPRDLKGQVAPRHRFGEADPHGLVGESPVAWALRERLAFVGRRGQHVLVLGESGTGKELVARALHALSPRAEQAMVSRNAATIPESLADAELFGNVANYPNPGMPARPGLVGEADRSTLFLDEFGELPQEQQARLLRVMDSGEYTRLGEARPRAADLRVIAATNRDPNELKLDVLARFPIRLQVPSLQERREDIPQLVVHLLRNIAREDPEIAQRFFPGGDPRACPRLALPLLAHLVARPYRTHVRELTALLWQAITAAEGDQLDVPSDGLTAPQGAVDALPSDAPVDPGRLDPQTIQEALDRHDGRQEPVWRELGLASRHVLARLVKKHGLDVRGRG